MATARSQFFDELMRAGRAVWQCFKPRKLDYACYGNVVPHVHWHIIPRKVKGPPPWTVSKFAKGKPASPEFRLRLARRLRRYV